MGDVACRSCCGCLVPERAWWAAASRCSGMAEVSRRFVIALCGGCSDRPAAAVCHCAASLRLCGCSASRRNALQQEEKKKKKTELCRIHAHASRGCVCSLSQRDAAHCVSLSAPMVVSLLTVRLSLECFRFFPSSFSLVELIVINRHRHDDEQCDFSVRLNVSSSLRPPRLRLFRSGVRGKGGNRHRIDLCWTLAVV
jgi:hypothetical protein